MKKPLMIGLLLCSCLSAYGQGCSDGPWKKLYGSSAFLYLEYTTCTEQNRLVESGTITKYVLKSIDREDTVICNVAITYSTRGKVRQMVKNDVVIDPGASQPFLFDAENLQSFKVDVVTIKFHSKP